VSALSRLFLLDTLPSRALDLLAVRTSRLGERRGIDRLTYNPLQMWAYHRLAVCDAPPVMAALEEVFPGARRLADVGAGSGAFAAEAQRHGHSVEACEFALGGRLYARWQGVRCYGFDLRREPPARLGSGFDLVYCFEVAEHLPADLGDHLVRFLAQLSPVMVFTAAPPGQGGLGHVNEQPCEYWIERFEREQARYDDQVTARLRATFRERGVHARWLVDNVMVFAYGQQRHRHAPDRRTRRRYASARGSRRADAAA
jgi:SAM-dependent methyltransferase